MFGDLSLLYLLSLVLIFSLCPVFPRGSGLWVFYILHFYCCFNVFYGIFCIWDSLFYPVSSVGDAGIFDSRSIFYVFLLQGCLPLGFLYWFYFHFKVMDGFVHFLCLIAFPHFLYLFKAVLCFLLKGFYMFTYVLLYFFKGVIYVFLKDINPLSSS